MLEGSTHDYVPTSTTTNGTSTVTTGLFLTTVAKWKFCPQCGEKLAEEWKFCAECGLAIGSLPGSITTSWPTTPQFVYTNSAIQSEPCMLEEFAKSHPGEPMNLYCSCPKCSPRC